MKRIIILVIACIIGIAAHSQDLQTVLSKVQNALKLDARINIPNLRTDGYFIMNGTEAKVPFKLIQMKPDKLRIETTVFGFKAIQTYDGNTAWLLSPTQGLEAVKSDPRDMEFIAAATSLEGPFSLNKSDKYTLKYGGKDTYNNFPVELLIMASPDERLKFYINSSTFLVDAVRYEYEKNGGWYSMEYRIKSYKDFKGSLFPGEITAVVNGVEMLALYAEDYRIIENLDLEKFGKPSF